MQTSTANVPTAHASRYLQQLCKHWSHKFETRFDAANGEIALPLGPVGLSASDGALSVRCTAGSATDLAKMQDVVAKHFERFAFREPDLVFDWRAA